MIQRQNSNQCNGSTLAQQDQRNFALKNLLEKFWLQYFGDSRGVILVDYLDKGKTMTGECYSSLLQKVREKIVENRREMVCKGVLFLQDNAPAHKSQFAMSKLRDLGFELVELPPYSPDLAPSDYYLFSKLKKNLKGCKFSSNEDVMEAVKSWFAGQEETFF